MLYKNMGKTATDKITGFSGTIISYSEYIIGCAQALLQPKVKSDGGFIDARWIDEDRLEISDAEPLTLKVTNPGPCGIAPIR